MELEAHPGDLLIPKFSCDLWSDDMVEMEELNIGDILLVLATRHAYAESHRPKKMRLNHGLYRRVLTPRGNVGWVHQDNCNLVDVDSLKNRRDAG